LARESPRIYPNSSGSTPCWVTSRPA
jgi:hypothetical protein